MKKDRLKKAICAKCLSFILILFFFSCTNNKDFQLTSPDGNTIVNVHFNREEGNISYRIQSQGTEIIEDSPVGIHTNLAEFSSEMKLKNHSIYSIDETYTLPQGKVSLYRNHANELTVKLKKEDQNINVIFRAYNDGVAFRYEIPGEDNIEITGEYSGINLVGEDFIFYGQNHPNKYGYESALGPIVGEKMSIPVLIHIKDKNHFVLIGQAATNGSYIQPHFNRIGASFKYSFPLDQEKTGPVRTKLPFQSPWRMIIISPQNPGKIVESYLIENLNPPTRPDFLKEDGSFKDWIKPGNVMWDYIAKDGDKPRMWINATAEMGWKYYMADAGFANRWGGPDSVLKIVEYAKTKNVNIIGWAHTREFNTPEKAAETMKRYSDWGLIGAKIDFFDHNTLSENPREWRDYEDTQQSLQMRDWIFELGIKNHFLLELHGNTVPTGERRQYPNLMTLEGVDGMERRAKPASNDLTIPYVRNIMGPVSYTVIHFERCPGTHAYQLAMPIIYEAGLKIYAEHGQKLLEWPGRELIHDLPAAWDDTKYIEGLPASHLVVARRKGKNWYIAGITDKPRTVNILFDFLDDEINYSALVFNDDSHTTMKREEMKIDNRKTLSLNLLERGGFAIKIVPAQ